MSLTYQSLAPEVSKDSTKGVLPPSTAPKTKGVSGVLRTEGGQADIDPEIQAMWKWYSSVHPSAAVLDALGTADATKEPPPDAVGGMAWYMDKAYRLLWGLTSGGRDLDDDARTEFRECQKGMLFLGLMTGAQDNGAVNEDGDTSGSTGNGQANAGGLTTKERARLRTRRRQLAVLQKALERANAVRETMDSAKLIAAIGGTILLLDSVVSLSGSGKGIAEGIGKGSASSTLVHGYAASQTGKGQGSTLEQTFDIVRNLDIIEDAEVSEVIAIEILTSDVGGLSKVRTYADLVDKLDEVLSDIDGLLQKEPETARQ